jgi:hypothetical protein
MNEKGINILDYPRRIMTDETFEKWWADDGRFYDPDTEDVPWFDKSKELAELAFAKGIEIGMARSGNYTANSEKMLDYALRETAEAVRIMHRDRSTLHVFDYGIEPDGTKHVFVLAILPEHVANKIIPPEFLKASKPFSGTANARDGAEPSAPEATKK